LKYKKKLKKKFETVDLIDYIVFIFKIVYVFYKKKGLSVNL